MVQEQVVNKALLTLKLFTAHEIPQKNGEVISRIAASDLSFIQTLFFEVYAAGWEQREMQYKAEQAHNKRPVAKYSLQGVLLGEYDSVVEAAKAS